MTLAARATDAKIRLWRIKHRRVQTAAVGLCRGVYVFVGRVAHTFPADYAPACADSRSGFMSGCLCIHWPGGAGSTVRNMSYNSRGDALTTVYGFLRG